VLRPKRLLIYVKCAQVETLGLAMTVLFFVQPGQVAEVCGHIAVFRPERLLADGKGALSERFGIGRACCVHRHSSPRSSGFVADQQGNLRFRLRMRRA
jgi:hypothetical protein